MATRGYGQYCGFARSLELVGERWALLIVRDLLVGPRRFSELQRGLPKVPSNILTTRLKELEEAGLVRRQVLPKPPGGFAYELTQDGRDLEEPVIALGRWGAKHLGELRPDEVITEDSMAMAMRTIFRPERLREGEEIKFQFHFGPHIAINAHVRNGTVTVGRGEIEKPDLVIDGGPAIRLLLAREITAKEALKNGSVAIRGKRALLDRFVELFTI